MFEDNENGDLLKSLIHLFEMRNTIENNKNGVLLNTLINLLVMRNTIFNEPLLFTSKKKLVFPDKEIKEALDEFNKKSKEKNCVHQWLFRYFTYWSY